MKKIEAIIRRVKLDEVKNQLIKKGACGMTVTKVKGCGREEGHTEIYRGAEFKIDLQPKFKIEILVKDDQLEEIIQVILQAAHTDKNGDGVIFVSDLQDMIRIRTADRGEDAI